MYVDAPQGARLQRVLYRCEKQYIRFECMAEQDFIIECTKNGNQRLGGENVIR